MPDALEITAQGTPNPNAAKFVLNRTLAAQGRTYRDPSAAEAEWVKQLLAIAGVTQVFVLNDFVSVTKAPQAQWAVISPAVEQILRQAFA